MIAVSHEFAHQLAEYEALSQFLADPVEVARENREIEHMPEYQALLNKEN